MLGANAVSQKEIMPLPVTPSDPAAQNTLPKTARVTRAARFFDTSPVCLALLEIESIIRLQVKTLNPWERNIPNIREHSLC